MNQVVQLWTGHSYTQKVEAKDQSSRADKFGLFFNNTTITTTCPQIDRSDSTNPVRHAFLFWTKVSSPPGTRILLLLVPILMLIHVEQGGASMATRTPKDDCMANTTANLTAQVEAGSDIPGCVRNKSDLSVGKKTIQNMPTEWKLRDAKPLSPQKSIELRWGCRRWRRFGFRFGTKPLDISKDATTMPILAAREEILPSPEKYSIISHSSLPASGPATKHPHRSTSKIKSWDARLVCSLPHWKETSEYTAYFWVFWINAAHGSLGALIATRRRNTSEISSGDMVSAAVCCCELENGSTQWWLSIALAKIFFLLTNYVLTVDIVSTPE